MFRTEVKVTTSELALSLEDKVVTVGSCFADVIGSKLQQHKVDALVNPFGTIFNPISVSLLLKAASGQPYDFEQHLVHNNGIWYAYDLHSSLSSSSKDELVAQIQHRLQSTSEKLQQASLLIITLGTALAYKLKTTGAVVANCHKLPAKNFIRTLLPAEEIVLAFEDMYSLLKLVNPQLEILLTVSPVRHTKETIEMNSVSKSMLRVVSHQLTQLHEDISYFPAYEIMLDDLRDYRFYKQDMLHPTETAEDYIWQKFISAYYNKEFSQFCQDWEKMQRALTHKAFHPKSPAHQKFLHNTLAQLHHLSKKYNINLGTEMEKVQKQLL